jgi:hypothetical protein
MQVKVWMLVGRGRAVVSGAEVDRLVSRGDNRNTRYGLFCAKVAIDRA